jgi:hypothetical protein
MRWLLLSATSTLPEAFIATPEGEEKRAEVPSPSANAPPVVPASVTTLRLGKMTRIRWLLESATYTLPNESSATPQGELNCAAVPTPSENPDTLPASVSTVLFENITLMRWLI